MLQLLLQALYTMLFHLLLSQCVCQTLACCLAFLASAIAGSEELALFCVK